MGTRDRVLGDANFVRPLEHRSESSMGDEDSAREDNAGDGLGGEEQVDVVKEPMYDINKYRFNRRF